jgi:heme-binding protein
MPTMPTAAGLRRCLSAVFAATALGGATAIALTTSSATAAPDPCAAGQIARTVGTVATNTGTYLDSHPQTNQALTTISQQQAGPQTLVALKGYFDANPQAGKDLQAVQQPLTSLSTQCKLPVSLPQLLGLLQATQSAAGTQGSAPAATTSVRAGSGPLPGPVAATTR